MNHAKPSIVLSHVEVVRGRRTVLSDLSFEARPGDVVGLMGNNGAGKTTLLNVIAGVLDVAAGTVRVMGRDVRSARCVRRGYCMEHPPFVGHSSGYRNLLDLGRLAGVSAEMVKAGMERVGLDPVSRLPVSRYSQGMVKRLALAQATLGNPPILLLDEPMNGLDPAGMQICRSVIIEQARAGATVVLSSHLLNELERLATYVYYLHNGCAERVASEVLACGRLEEAFFNKHMMES